MSTQITTQQFEGRVIAFHAGDGFMNATALCKAAGKLFADYRRLSSTGEFLSEMARSMGIPIDHLVYSVTDGPNNGRGTWVHPDVAIHLAQWCSAKVAVWCSQALRRILSDKTGSYSQGPALPDFNNPVIAARAWADEMEAKQALALEVARLAPKAATFDIAMCSEGLLSMNTASKLIGAPGRNRLMKRLKEKGVFLKNNLPAQKFLDSGYFVAKQAVKTDRHGMVRVFQKSMVTQKGLDFLRRCMVRLSQLDTATKAIADQANFPTISNNPPPRLGSLVEAFRAATQTP